MLNFGQKFRPRKFSEVLGNKNILKGLTKYAVKRDFPQIMFFTGQTGSGKTTISRIIGLIVNCSSPVMNDEGYYDPCLECPSCKSIINEKFGRDYLEYNGSAIGKDSILKLSDEASSAPFLDINGKKIIVIDEAQNISASGKDASLRFLEVDRPDTIIILCTMEDNAFDQATYSRGERFKFNSLSVDDIGESMIRILEEIDPEEKIPEEFITKGLPLIIEVSKGSARDAVNHLQHLVNSEIFSIDDIEEELEVLSEEKGYNILNKLMDLDSSALLDIKKSKSTSFFYYAEKAITGIMIDSMNTADTSSIKAVKGKKLLDNKNFKPFCECLYKIKQDSPLIEDFIFYLNLIKFIEQNKVNGLTKSPEVRVRQRI